LVSWYDWLLFLHVAAAFSLVGALTVFWMLVAAAWRVVPELSTATQARIAAPATVAVAVGLVGTLVFGIWLAIYVDGYELWDGWILASLVLWAIGAETGRRSGAAFTLAAEPDAETDTARHWRRGVLFHAAASAAALLILIMMIFKPGA
jgi:uncharacterized membrane protein